MHEGARAGRRLPVGRRRGSDVLCKTVDLVLDIIKVGFHKDLTSLWVGTAEQGQPCVRLADDGAPLGLWARFSHHEHKRRIVRPRVVWDTMVLTSLPLLQRQKSCLMPRLVFRL